MLYRNIVYFLSLILEAELVAWNPVGDQYVIGYATTLSICDVQVNNMLILKMYLYYMFFITYMSSPEMSLKILT